MDNYISRQAAIETLDEQVALCDKALKSFEISMKDEYAVKVERASLVAYKEQFEAMPSADVAPVIHSQWKYKCGEIQCPKCGNRIHRIDLSGCLNFCPNCGADMRKSL